MGEAVVRNDVNESEESSGGRLRAVDRVCDILDLIAVRSAEAPVALADIAIACGLPKTSAFRYLATLESRRYVERVGDGAEYRLGLAMANFNGGHYESLISAVTPLLEELRDEFGETANLGVLAGRHISYLAIVESRRSVRLAARRGDRDDLHCTALGKAVAAQFSNDRVHELIGDEYERRTEKTLTTWVQLRRELELVRTSGYAVDEEENEVGGRCVAVAVPGRPGVAISVSAPVTSFSEKDLARVAARLGEVAQKISEAAPA